MDVEFTLNGQNLRCPMGYTVAAALFFLGHRTMRLSAKDATARSLFCGMGLCYDCVMQIDGQSNVRACQTIVQPGMKIEVQQGEGDVGEDL